MFSNEDISFIYMEEAMTVQIGMNGYDYEDPSNVDECGPSGPCMIEDTLSHARCHYLCGVDVLWIWSNYRVGLEEMIKKHSWRSTDAVEFYSLLQRQVSQQYGIPVVVQEMIAAPQ